MSGFYLDTSVLIPLFLPDVFAARARAFIATCSGGVLVSNFSGAEFASVVGIRCRTKALSIAAGRAAFANFDTWTSRFASIVVTDAADILAATAALRRLDLTLRTPDAIHIAVAQGLGAEFATFDTHMAECARALGAKVPAI